jgi:hypothetical protein
MWAGGTFFLVVVLCQLLVLMGNRFWFYILMYLEYNTVVVGGPREKMSFFQIASGPILSIPIHSNTCQYDPCKVLSKKNDPFLTYEPPKVSIFWQ